MDFSNEVAVITGSGSSIGRVIALMFAQKGANVVIIDILDDDINAVVREVEQIVCQALGIKCDIGNKKEVEQAAKTTIDRFKHVDILVNNAGVHNISPAEELSEEDWDRVVDTNLKGTLLCCQAFGRYMIERGKGRIVNIASASAHRGIPERAAYCASKAGVLGLTRALAVEWVERGVTVNSVSPSMTKSTKILQFMETQPVYKERVSRIPRKHLGEPEDVAYSVAFLSSSDSRHITGVDIAVDGGQLAMNPLFVHYY